MNVQERTISGEVEVETASLRRLVDSLPAMVAYWDSEQRCRFANRAYEKWFGVSPEALIGTHIRELLGPLYALNLPYIEGALRGETQEFEREIPDPAGGPARFSQALYIPDFVGGKVRGFSVLVTDITRRQRAEAALVELERQLQVAERLTAMALLAGGIAHEVNNPLMAVLGNIDLALENLDSQKPDPRELRELLVEASIGAKRVRDTVQHMKLLSRADGSTREVVNVEDALEYAMQAALNAIQFRARLVREFDGVAFVRADVSQLVQVFVNLLVNVAQAFEKEQALANSIRVCMRIEGEHVVVEVGDNRSEPPAAFEPFFAPEDVRRGVGLRLTVSQGLVTALGGTLLVSRDASRGSVFQVRLPCVAPPVSAEPTVCGADLDLPAVRKPDQRPRILVIDDELALGQILQRALSRDYDVTLLTHGRDAIALLSAADTPGFDLILCDLMMPDVNGEDVFETVTRAEPDLAKRFVFMTGGAFTPRAQRFLAEQSAVVLEKPFDMATARDLLEAELARLSVSD